MCSLEEPEAHEQQATYGGSPWGNLAQRAFYVPNEHIGKAWEWAKAHRGDCDVLKHPNTGWCVPRVWCFAAAVFGATCRVCGCT